MFYFLHLIKNFGKLVAVFLKKKTYKLLIQQSIQLLNLASEHVELLRKEMDILASTLPEYTTVMSIYGVGKTFGPRNNAKSNRASKIGSARLRKSLFQIMTTLLQNAPEDDPVY